MTLVLQGALIEVGELSPEDAQRLLDIIQRRGADGVDDGDCLSAIVAVFLFIADDRSGQNSLHLWPELLGLAKRLPDTEELLALKRFFESAQSAFEKFLIACQAAAALRGEDISCGVSLCGVEG